MSMVNHCLASASPEIEISWEAFEHESVLRCNALLCPEESGFSVHFLNLPGVISQGECEEQAVTNITDAFRETVLYFRESKQPIPWGDVEVERTAGCRTKYILVRF